jgi:integrase
MADCGECDPRVADAIQGPRLYAQESVPSGPAWSDVHRILAHAGGDAPADVRDRAILMLLAIYGMRSGEVRSMRLDQIDWPGRVLRVFRLKRRQPQVYPLLQSVAEAVARYIETARPKAAHPEIFLGLQAPHGPLSSGAMSALVRHRFMALGIQAVHRGPHALRHACAARLVAEGLTMKEIGDHLGHRTTRATGNLRQDRPVGTSGGWRLRFGGSRMKLSEVIDAYILVKTSLGMSFDSARRLLGQFSREVGNPPLGDVQAEAVAAFLRGRGALNATWGLKYRILSGFYKFAISRGYADSSALPANVPKLPPQQSPYVYSIDELRRLLEATSVLHVNISPDAPHSGRIPDSIVLFHLSSGGLARSHIASAPR